MKKVDNKALKECRDQTANEKRQNQTFKIASSDVRLKKEFKMKVFKLARTIFTQTFHLWDLTKTEQKFVMCPSSCEREFSFSFSRYRCYRYPCFFFF